MENKFVPRFTDDGLTSNAYFSSTGYWTTTEKYLYKNAPASGSDSWQCTYHALARSCEIAHRPVDRRWNSEHPIFPNRDGWPDAKNFPEQTGWAVGSTPKLGAIVVWTDSVAGHVGIVEKVYNDGYIDISQANLTIDGTKRKFWLHEHCLPTDSLYTGKGLTFTGKYVYNPYAENTSIRVDRDTSVDQIYANANDIRVREEHNTSSNILGRTETDAYYNVNDTYDDGTHVWYQVSNEAWIAGTSGITYYPATPVPPATKKIPFSMYANSEAAGVAFGKKATVGNTIDFADGWTITAHKNGDTISIDAYDLIAAVKQIIS